LPSNKLASVLTSFLEIDSQPLGLLIGYNKKSPKYDLRKGDFSLDATEFTHDEEKLFKIITRQAQNTYLHLRRHEDIQKIHEVGVALSSSRNINEILKVVTQTVLDVFGADIVTLYQYDQRKNDFIGLPFFAGELFQPQFVSRKPRKDDLAFEVIKDKKNYYASDAINDPKMSRRNVLMTEGTEAHFVLREKIKSSAAILLRADEDVVGVMFINFRRAKSFPVEEKYVLEVFASYAAVAIRTALDKKQLTDKLTLSLSRLNAIREQATYPTDGAKEEFIYKIVLDAILDLLNEKLGLYAEVSSDNERFIVRTTSDLYKKFEGTSWHTDVGVTSQALKKREIQIVYDTAKDEHFVPLAKVEYRIKDLRPEEKSSISIPLILDDKVHGVFHIDSTSLESFSEYDKLILDAFIDQAAKSIQAAKLAQEKDLAFRKLVALRNLDHLIGSTWNLDTVLKSIVDTAIELTKQENVVGILDLIEPIDGKPCLVPYTTSGVEVERKAVPLDSNETIARLAVVENRTINVTATDELWKQNYSVLIPGMLSELAVPLRVRNKPIGVVYVESPDPKAFDKEDEEFLETLAGQAVIVIQMTRVINDIKAIDSAGLSESMENFLELILSKAEKLVGAELGAIWLLDYTMNQFKLGGYSGFAENIWKGKDIRLGLDNSFIGSALKHNQIAVAQLDEPLDDSMTASRETFKNLLQHGLKSIISAPFVTGKTPIGVMNIYTKEKIIIDEWEKSWEKSLLELFAAQASIALLNFQRYAELQKAKIESEQSVNKIIFDNMRQMLKLVTHRMNNSVGNIRADVIDLLNSKSKFDKKTVKKLKDIQDEAQEALGIPKELNNFVKKLKSDKIEVHVYDVIRDIIKDKDTRRIKIYFDSLKNVPSVKANQGLLKEVFNELIQNAMKAMPAGGEIMISAQKVKSKMLEMQVKDTGHGISKENLDKIFEYGFTHWENAKGTGDGLPIIRTVIEVDHEGKISVESEEGKGCTVKLALPVFEKT
jgi:GAF domain-containing protein